MNLLKPASNQTAFAKIGMYGFQGAGKTYTASHLAAGLAKLSNPKSPKVAFFDTEKGSDFMIKYFASQNIGLDVAKSQAFSDLADFMREVEAEKYDVAIIDSVSHVWSELMDSYQKRLKRQNGLLFQDWGKVKGEWKRQFADMFINSKLHVIVLARAGWDYDTSADESGKMQLTKTGTKMRAEGEFGYESDMLLELERVKNPNKGKGWVNRCTVLKDRTDTINGKVFDYPKFEDFKPFLQAINIGGEHFGVDTDSNSQEMFDSPDRSYAERQKQRDIALEELSETLTLHDLGGSSEATKKLRLELLSSVFGTSSKTAIEGLHPEKIREGISKIKAQLDTVTVAEDKGM